VKVTRFSSSQGSPRKLSAPQKLVIHHAERSRTPSPRLSSKGFGGRPCATLARAVPRLNEVGLIGGAPRSRLSSTWKAKGGRLANTSLGMSRDATMHRLTPPALRMQGDGRDLLTADEASRLKVRSSWVKKAARANRIPHVMVGRYVRFTWPDIEALDRESKAGCDRRGWLSYPLPAQIRERPRGWHPKDAQQRRSSGAHNAARPLDTRRIVPDASF
jgi:hypothetical protein